MGDRAFEKGRWTLEDLIADKKGPALEEAFDEVEAAVAALEAKREALTPTIAEAAFVEILRAVEKATAAGTRLFGFSGLLFTEDTGDQESLALRGRVDKVIAEAENRTLFFDLWWKKLDDENAQRLLTASGDVAYYLETLRRFAPFTLSEAEEKVINIKNVNGTEGLVTLYDMITNAFTYDVEIDGETKTLTRSEVMVYARDPSPARREAAYRALFGVYEPRKGELAQIYKYVASDWSAENVDLRGVASPISVRNLRNDIPDEVVDLLLQVCRDNVGLYQRFFGLKAKWLGLPKLKRFDVYAPLDESSEIYPFAEGVKIVLDSMRKFSPEVAENAERVLAENHLDSEPREGKDTGAFCYGVLPELTPWVLVNYNDRADDVSTLAHELGHAVHAMLASDHSILTHHSSLPLAETASNFAEMLLLEALLDRNDDPAFRRTMLAKYVDDSYAMVLRQAYFVLFEREAHRMIQEEGATPDQLSAAYLANLREQFGDSIELDEVFQTEWVTIPHIYATPFYCYAYTFGLLLVLGLFQRYKEEGEAFVPKYLKILAYGGAKAPMAILDEVGIDIRTREFWQGGFDLIAGMIDELEALS